MQIIPRNNLLLIDKHKKTALRVDIRVAENDEDKRLITGSVVYSPVDEYKKGDTVIFGKYALLTLTVRGEDFYFLDIDDVVGTCDYKE